VTAGFLTDRFLEHPSKRAIAAPAGSCTFGELTADIRRWESDLKRSGVRSGDVVGLEGDFSPRAIALLIALVRQAAIIVPQDRDAHAGRRSRNEIAEIEAYFRIDGADVAHFERTGRTARHRLYDELRRRGRPGLVQFSSGTSGEPKAAVHDFSLLLEKFRTRRPAWTTLAFLLFDHLGGINTMLHTLSNGATLVATGSRSPDAVCRLIEEHRVELLPATPTFLNLLLIGGAHRRHDLRSLRVISYGAEPISPTTLERLHAAFPEVRLQQTYGMVEVGALRTKSRDDESPWLKVGGEGVETRIVDGVLQIRTPSLLLGYLNAPSPITADGWLHTGDRVERDGEYLRFLGRESDLINVGGEKVYPAEVESVIESMEEIETAVVHGEPNPLLGQIVCARVKPRRPVPSDLQRLVKRHCRERLERFKVPMKVAVLEEHPIGARLKKDRHEPSGAESPCESKNEGGRPD
jgi:long-chain acyl-CoA synthetase